MREASWLARTSINRNSHINHVLDLSEQVVQVAVAHVEGHVADEEGFRGSVEGAVGEGGAGEGAGAFFRDAELNGEAAAFEVLEVVEFDGFGGGFDGFKLYVAESV